MLTRLTTAVAARTRLVVFVAIALLAGGTGGIWAATNATDPQVSVTTVAGEQKGQATATAAKRAKASKKAPGRGPASPGQGGHGSCVSAVARSGAEGGPNDNHGGAISKVAHTCAKNGSAGAHRATKRPKAPKPSPAAIVPGGQRNDGGKPPVTASPTTAVTPSGSPTSDSPTSESPISTATSVTPTGDTTTITATATP